jgi:hypothetical protein
MQYSSSLHSKSVEALHRELIQSMTETVSQEPPPPALTTVYEHAKSPTPPRLESEIPYLSIQESKLEGRNYQPMSIDTLQERPRRASNFISNRVQEPVLQTKSMSNDDLKRLEKESVQSSTTTLLTSPGPEPPCNEKKACLASIPTNFNSYDFVEVPMDLARPLRSRSPSRKFLKNYLRGNAPGDGPYQNLKCGSSVVIPSVSETNSAVALASGPILLKKDRVNRYSFTLKFISGAAGDGSLTFIFLKHAG